MVEKLKKSEVDTHFTHLKGWQLSKDGLAISKAFRFGNFIEAFSFMTRVAFVAEKMDHHPEWLNIYNRVEINLTTHDCDGLSIKDFNLAMQIDAL